MSVDSEEDPVTQPSYGSSQPKYNRPVAAKQRVNRVVKF
jgi:hypothetical protein